MILLNEIPVQWFKFPAGEINVRLPEDIPEERVILTCKPVSSDEIMVMLLSVNALKIMGIRDIDVDLLYLPYGRQDRACNAGEAFSLEVMVSLLDSMHVSCIRTWDLHSNRSYDMFVSRVEEIECADIFERYKILDEFDLSNLILCAPDFGARYRVSEIVRRLELSPSIYLDKVRDLSTGNITSMEYPEDNRDISSFNVLLIDDICDVGRTFIEAAKLLKDKGAENLYLYVTHGIFSNGLEDLFEYYTHIHCHHVLDDNLKSSDRLTILREFHYVT